MIYTIWKFHFLISPNNFPIVLGTLSFDSCIMNWRECFFFHLVHELNAMLTVATLAIVSNLLFIFNFLEGACGKTQNLKYKDPI